MEKINPIAAELQELGSSLANYPAMTPYGPVPGYFEGFPDLMLVIVKGQEPSLSLPAPKTPFNVPAGYFDGLAGNIINRLRTADEPYTNAGAGPELSAADEIASLSPLLNKVSRTMPYSTPDRYFSDLPGEIPLYPELLSPRMLELRNAQVFKVPEGYFEQLPATMLSMVQPPAKVVRGNFGQRLARYAVAAAVAAVMITGGFFLVNRNQDTGEIVSVKRLEEKAAQTSDEDILQYLENQPVPSFDVQPVISDKEIKEDAILDMLADVSDEELQQYVQYQSDTKPQFN